jgi:hypothetical protein
MRRQPAQKNPIRSNLSAPQPSCETARCGEEPERHAPIEKLRRHCRPESLSGASRASFSDSCGLILALVGQTEEPKCALPGNA